MAIREQLMNDIKTTMREKNQVKLDCLRFLQAAIKKQEIDSRPKELTEDDVMAVIKKSVKQHQDSITQFQAANRQDLADKEIIELKILEGYLPAQMDRAQIEKIVAEVMTGLGATPGPNAAKQMGAIIKEVQARTAGAADNKVISEIVKAKLQP
jgi:uncharacterized protein YqeY